MNEFQVLNATVAVWINDTERMVLKIKVQYNKDKQVVEMIKTGLKEKDGYCPCRIDKTPENKCLCKEFREQINDPSFEGYCHCMLYYKSL